jgi:ribose transport system substrate-binding protein
MFAGGWTEVKRENMRIRSRTRMVVAAAAVLALVLSACGGDEAAEPEDDTSEDTGSDDGDADDEGDDEAAGDDSLIDEEYLIDPAEFPLDGYTIGVAVVGTQHFWDREAFQGAVAEVERLGGTVVTTDGGRDNTVHAENHDVFLSEGVDAVITILGDDAVEPKLQALSEADIPVFGVDRDSQWAVNNSQSDNEFAGRAAGELLSEYLGGEGKVAVFNAFSEALEFCGVRYDSWREVMDADGIEVLQPELAEEFANAPEDARQQTLTLLQRYPEGEIDAIHVACWDQPAIGVVQAIEEAGRDDVVVSAIDAGPDTLEIMMEENSPFVVNVAQQPRLIATIAAQNVAKYLNGEDVEDQSYLEVFPALGPDGAREVFETLGYDQ